MNSIAIVILVALFFNAFLSLAADLLNLKQLRTNLPESFQGWYDADRYAQSQRYLKDTTCFGWFVEGVDLIVLLALWFGGGFALLENWVRGLSYPPVAAGIVYIGVLAVAKSLLSLPFGFYRTFVIEQRHGFNQATVKTFLIDRIKAMILAVLLGVPLLAVVLAFFQYAGGNAWFYCWVAVVCFMLVVHYVAPTWIMPLFNRFDPLPDGALREAIVAYAGSINFALDNIFVMDGSKRSGKSNAFFTGFGKHRRIVLFDTLIDKHTVAELVAILAHEMGHYKQRHVLKMLLIGIGQAGLMFYLLSLFVSYPGLFEAFYVSEVSVYAGLVFFSLLYAPLAGFSGLATQAVSRRHEYEADRFAVKTAPNGVSLATALKKLAAHNLSNLMPHPLYVLLHGSHPPVLQRIAAIEGQHQP